MTFVSSLYELSYTTRYVHVVVKLRYPDEIKALRGYMHIFNKVSFNIIKFIAYRAIINCVCLVNIISGR
jgi:hypothetical protein